MNSPLSRRSLRGIIKPIHYWEMEEMNGFMPITALTPFAQQVEMTVHMAAMAMTLSTAALAMTSFMVNKMTTS